MIEKSFFSDGDINLCYYETPNDGKPLVLIHGAGVDGMHFKEAIKYLSKFFHVYSIDCYGHGESLHDKSKYTVTDIGEAVIHFVKTVIKENVQILGHSLGGFVATYVAAKSNLCDRLILEDVPLFNVQGEDKKNSLYYRDFITLCHKFVSQSKEKNFPLYYFKNNYLWKQISKDIPEKKLTKMMAAAEKCFGDDKKKLKIPGYPKEALYAFEGMKNFDPYFGEAFYNDSFHNDISYDALLKDVWCETFFFKANHRFTDDGIFIGAIDDDGLTKATGLLRSCSVTCFDCGHNIHKIMPKAFAEHI